MNTQNGIAALKLVVVECDGERELVSLAHRESLCCGDFEAGEDVPLIIVGEAEELDASGLAGVWPGWDVLFPWLDKKFDLCVAEARKGAADAAFADYGFGDECVKDTGSWQTVGPDEWNRPVYLERGDGPSEKVMFVVRFEPGTSEVRDNYMAG